MNGSLKPSAVRLILTCLVIAGVAMSALGLGAGLGTVAGAAPPPPGFLGASPRNSTPQPLPFTQNWTNTGLITVNDDWSAVPGVEGFLGDTPGSTVDINPQTIITPNVSTTIDVIANQTNPNTQTAGGVAEFEITDPVVALQGSGTADHPNLVIYLNTTGASNINVAYNLRDIDGSADNAVQQVALQYRVGNIDNFTNIAAGYVADATTGPDLATLVTPVSVALPAAADNQPQVQVRIITSNAVGSDEWVGVDDINITAGGATATPGGPTNTTAPTSTATSTATASITPGGPTNTSTATATAVVSGSVRIRDIQGLSHLSPLSGTMVSNVYGIVTVKRSNGFYMQDPQPDANVGTSEAIFVFGSSAAGVVQVGDAAFVSGTVAEFRPGCSPSCAPSSSAFDNLTISQIASSASQVVTASTSMTITPVIIGTGGRIPPMMVIDDDAMGSVETSGTFDPTTDGIDFYESLEFMLVQVNGAVAVGPTSEFGTGGAGNREVVVVGDNGANANLRTPRGGVLIRPTDFNPERIIVNNLLQQVPDLNVGDTFNTPIIGVYDYSFAKYLLYPTQPFSTTSGGLMREIAPTPQAGQLTIGSFNVENLDPGDPPSKFSALASLIVNNLRSPDIITVEEIQDNDGPTNSGIVSATLTYNELISYTVAAGGPTYEFRQVDPVNNQDGGEPGGNIRVGFLYRTDRGLTFVDRPGGCSTCAVTVGNVGGTPQLSFSPGRIDPANPAFNNSRKPLAGEFMYNGRKLFLIGNHFNSKGGDDPLFGRFQPPILNSETQRAIQAQIVNDFVDNILAVDANSYVVVLGDLNDFEFSRPLRILRGTEGGGPEVLKPLIETLPANERYSYVFQGNSQSLDHIFVSNGLLGTLALYDVVHINSEYFDQVSDHDPQVAYFGIGGGTPTASVTASVTAIVTSTATMTATSTSTSTATLVPTMTATRTVTVTITATSTSAASSTATRTATATAVTSTPTRTLTATGTTTPIISSTATRTVTPAVSSTSTRTNIPMPSMTPTTASTNTPINTPVSTATAQPTNTLTRTPVAPSATSTAAMTNTATLAPPTSTRTPIAPSVTSVPPSATSMVGTSTSIPPTVVPTAVPCTLQFTDVPTGNTFYANVRCLACKGIIGGYPCGGAGEPCGATNNPYFRPNNDITRGQISKIVSESAGFGEDPGAQVFEDVASGSTFYNWINRLFRRGLIGGYPCGQVSTEPCVTPGNRPYFRPQLNATRGQLSKIVSNAAGFSEPVSGQFFTDVPANNPFYEWIERLSRRGVMGGYPCGQVPGEPCDTQNRPYFRWGNTVTRGQASKIVSNTFFPACQPPLAGR